MTRSAPTAPRYKVLMLAPTMFFADYGAHVRILEEATSLRDLGHRLTIAAYPNGRDIAGLDVQRCWGVPFNYRVIVGSSRHKFYLDAMLAIKSLQVMVKTAPDVIHAHLHEGALIGAVLGKLWRVPVVFDFQGSLVGEMVDHRFLPPDGALHRTFRWLEERIDQFPDAVITSSQNAAHLLRTEFGRTKGHLYTIADCTNPDVFHPGVISAQERVALRARFGIPPEAKVVVYLGILQDYQGIPHLIRAARQVIARCPDTYFLILGFPVQARYVALIDELGIGDRVRMPGMVPYGEAPKHLAIGDIAAAPKLSETEGAGKLLNYMSIGLPVVAFDTPVSREYLGDLGLCAPAGNVDGLAAAILSLLSDPAGARERGRLLRERVIERYTWAQIGERITEVYQKVCSPSAGVL
ncbi:MAG: glycosyltransferase family 4 protein [Anaerolineae bacterium]|nr:glycosyltransferase family 4 protein [Anaerolineae bacterium]